MSGEKTEKATPKKLRDARKKGEVASSKEVVSSAMILSSLILIIATAGDTVDRLKAMIRLPVPFLDQPATEAAGHLIPAFLTVLTQVLAPYLLVAVLVAVAANTGQFGLLLSMESIKPSLGKLSPSKWFKKTLGLENLIEFLRSIIKITVLTLVLFFLIRDGLQAIVTAPLCGIPCLQSVLSALMVQTVLWSAGPFVVMAMADFAFQKWNFGKKNRMSKDETKREYKEAEGDPQIKGMRKQLHQEMLSESIVDRSRSATMLVTNPTHVAVAIVYREGETPLPIVSAMGTDLVARRMMEAAAAAGVPIMRDVPLARALLETGSIDQYIPSELIEAFAETLRALNAMQA